MPEPTRIGKYEIIEEIGRGGFATVYKARDPSLERIVALKVLHPHISQEKIVRRFEKEARTAANFTHPNIVTIYEVGQDAGRYYIAMEYLPGRGLDKWLATAGGPLPLREITSILEQVTNALDYIHQSGAVHRDVKPANVILSQEGKATLVDFGIVRAADGTDFITASETMGTPQYMSPEQADGNKIDHRSDIYSLGIMVYEMCTGKTPFDDVSPLVILRLHADKPPPLPHLFNPNLPDGVEQVLLKALAKHPGERYQSAGAFAQALTEALVGSDRERQWKAHLSTSINWIWPAIRSWPWKRIAGVVGGLACIFLAAILWPRLSSFLPDPTETPTATLAEISVPTQSTTPTSAYPTATTTATATSPPPTETPVPAPTATPTLSAGAMMTRELDGMVMVYVPEGTFQMGSDERDSSAEADEFPKHTVTLSSFWIDQTEVANAQYALCEAEGVCNPPLNENSYTRNSYYNNEIYQDYPVIYVSWNDANAYCDWVGGRLPTEAEWEYAARGEQEQIYPWGNEQPTCDKANYDGCIEDTAAVDNHSYSASWVNAWNMAGNVLEWVSDWYQASYPDEAQTDPIGPTEDAKYRVLRGGAWYSPEIYVRAANRGWGDPDSYDDGIGFRCVIPAEE